jgi:hypothetical protein
VKEEDMAKDLFSMYCGLNAISGMHEEKEKASVILGEAKQEHVIVLFYMNNTAEWVYGQCSFIHDKEHTSPFKFSNTYTLLREQGVLPALIDAHGVDKVLFTESSLLNRFAADPATRRYASRFALVSDNIK